MNIALNPSIWGNGQFTAVPSIIIDKHMRLCGSLPLKVILLILRDNEKYNNETSLADKLKTDINDVSDAINYWAEAGIIILNDEQKNNNHQSIHTEIKSPEPKEKIKEENIAIAPLPEKKFILTREEVISLVKNDKLLSDLVTEAQAIFGKLLTSADMDTLVALYSYYSLSPHFIVTLLTYCASINKKGMAYAKTVAETWLADGIDDLTVDSHVDKLLFLRSIEGRLKKSLGLDRNFVKSEKEYIEKWTNTLKIEIPTITEAFEACVTAIGKMNFKYMDKILTDWHQKGIENREQAKNHSNSSGNSKSGNTKKEKEPSQFMKLLMENYDKE